MGEMNDRPGAEDGPDPAIGEMDNREDSVTPVLRELKDLREAFDAKIRYDEGRERLIESMSEELSGYRQNLYQKLLRPVLLDLIGLHDDLLQVLESADCPGVTTAHLEFFRGTVEQILARNGADPFVTDGETIDRVSQKVVSVTDTSDADLDRRLERRLRPGFTWNGKVLRPEWVRAYRYTPLPAADSAQSAEESRNDQRAEVALPNSHGMPEKEQRLD